MKDRNITASVRARLLNLARETKWDFNLVLTRYAIERLQSLGVHRQTLFGRACLEVAHQQHLLIAAQRGFFSSEAMAMHRHPKSFLI
jgi:hypothetical protein